MADNNKIIQLQFPIGIPFAENGAKTSVPETSGDGSVSYDQGYTASYDLPPADGGRFIERTKLNQVFNKAFNAIKEIQNFILQEAIPVRADNVSGVLGVENGGTGANSADGAWENIGGGNLGKLDEIDFASILGELPTNRLSGTITNAQLAGGIAQGKLAGGIPTSKISGLATVATSGNYDDLTNKPNNPTNAAPLPKTASGVGQWVNIYGSSYTLPSGGSWLYFITNSNAQWQSLAAVSGVLPGGSQIYQNGAYIVGWAWRIQ